MPYSVDLKHVVMEHDQQMSQVRAERTRRLSACDWTQLPDVLANMPYKEKTAWEKYRKALREITEGLSDPKLVVWPKPPDGKE